jgi:hypothetical protein
MDKMNKLTHIDQKIERLKKKKTKIQLQQAVHFIKEVEKIFQEGFTQDLALAVLSEWTTASDTKKKEWASKSYSFRPVSVHHAQRKTQTREPAHSET